MNLELMAARRITAGLVYPPRPLQKAQLTSLYSQITSRYEFAQFQLLPDGARLGHGDQSECLIQAGPQGGRIQVNENISTHFEMSKQKAADLFQMIATGLQVEQYIAFGVKIIASCPTDESGDAGKLIERGFLKLSEADFAPLGSGKRGTGIRINLHRDGVYDIRIEPLFRDTRFLHVELDVQFAEPFVGLDTVEPRMDTAYGFLFGELKEFMASAMA